MATSLKRSAVREGLMRRLCLSTGQLYHQVESRISLRLLGHEAKRVKEMKEEDAVQLGANFVSEAFLFSTAGLLLLWEMGRKGRDDARSGAERKEKDRQREERWQQRMEEMQRHIDREREHREDIQRQLDALTQQLHRKRL